MRSPLDLREGPGGVTLKLKVKPRAKRSGITGVRGGALVVSVTAPPEKGKANKAVIDVLAEAFNVPKGAIEIVAGETRPEKIVRLRGITARQVLERLPLQ
jgi:uncharacterized protein (TIGR00251 family)